MLIHEPMADPNRPSLVSMPIKSPDFQISDNPACKQAFDYYMRNKRGLSPEGFKSTEAKSKLATLSAPLEKEALKQRYRLKKNSRL